MAGGFAVIRFFLMRCKSCKDKFEVRFFNQKFCLKSDECRSEAADFAIKQKEKNFKTQCAKERKEYKAKNKTYTQKINEAKVVFQKWIRLVKDKGRPCISCGTIMPDSMDGGHYLKAEIYSGLIFDERNVSAQCRKCNRFLNGNELNYRDGLIKRYGIDYLLQLEGEKNAKRVHKWSEAELEEIKRKYKI